MEELGDVHEIETSKMEKIFVMNVDHNPHAKILYQKNNSIFEGFLNHQFNRNGNGKITFLETKEFISGEWNNNFLKKNRLEEMKEIKSNWIPRIFRKRKNEKERNLEILNTEKSRITRNKYHLYRKKNDWYVGELKDARYPKINGKSSKKKKRKKKEEAEIVDKAEISLEVEEMIKNVDDRITLFEKHLVIRTKYLSPFNYIKPSDLIKHGIGEDHRNEEFYIGEFKDNKRQGKGILINKIEKTHFFGFFDNNLYSGTGVLKNFYEKIHFFGRFEDSKYNGLGLMYFPKNKIALSGTFKNNKKFGNVKLLDNYKWPDYYKWAILFPNEAKILKIMQTKDSEAIKETKGVQEVGKIELLDDENKKKKLDFIFDLESYDYFFSFLKKSYFGNIKFITNIMSEIYVFVEYLYHFVITEEEEKEGSRKKKAYKVKDKKGLKLQVKKEISNGEKFIKLTKLVHKRLGKMVFDIYARKYRERDKGFCKMISMFDIDTFEKKFKKKMKIESYDLKVIFENSIKVLKKMQENENVMKKIDILEELRSSVISDLSVVFRKNHKINNPNERIVINVDEITEVFIILLVRSDIKNHFTQFALINDWTEKFILIYSSRMIMSVKYIYKGVISYLERMYEIIIQKNG